MLPFYQDVNAGMISRREPAAYLEVEEGLPAPTRDVEEMWLASRNFLVPLGLGEKWLGTADPRTQSHIPGEP
jgi:hypothetical protein